MFLEKRIIKNNITVDKEIEIGSQPSYVIKFTDSDNCSSSLAVYEEELKDLLMALQNISEKPENSVTDFQTFYMVGYTDIPVFEERNLKSYTFIEQEFWEYKEAREYVKNAKEKQTYCIAQVTYKYYS